MATWFPALRFALDKRLAPHLPPRPLRVVAGAALAALVAWCVIGVIAGVYYGGTYIVDSTTRLAQTLGQSTADVLKTIPHATPPAAMPPQTTAEAPPPPTDSATQEPLAQGSAAQAEAPLPVVYPEIKGSPSVRQPLQPTALPYAEGSIAVLTDKARQVDYALYQTLLRLGLERSRLELLQTETREHPAQGETPATHYLFQRMRAHLPLNIQDFTQAAESNLEAWADKSEAELISKNGRSVLRIKVQDVLTHEVFLYPSGSVFIPPPADGVPRMSIVIDDLGESIDAARALLALDIPISFSILPYTSKASKVATLAHAAGHEVLIHQPMEPMQSPYIKPGPNALLMNMSPDSMRQTIRHNAAILPQAVGMNNHMGSRLTRDADACRIVADEAIATGLFVLDSLTHPESLLLAIASQADITSYRRDFFLDDGSPSQRSIVSVLRKAEAQALRTGQAVVIGHPRPETLAALKEWATTRDTAVAVTPLRYQVR